MNKMIVACLILQTVFSESALAQDEYNSFLHDQATISRMSQGKVQKSSTFIWSTPISPLALGTDERKIAAVYGLLTVQARFLNIQFVGSNSKNFIIFNDTDSIDIFLKDKIKKLDISKQNIEKITTDLKNMSLCETVVIPDEAGRIQSVFVTNMYPYGTANFSGCLQMMSLRAFGVYLKNDHFADDPNKDPSNAYRFLLDIYQNADRERPFVSISPR